MIHIYTFSLFMMDWIGRQLLFSTLILIFIMLILMIRKRASIQFKFGLWSLFWVRLLLPPNFALPFSLRQILGNALFFHTHEFDTFHITSNQPLFQNVLVNIPSQIMTTPQTMQTWLVPGLMMIWLSGVIIFGYIYLKKMNFYKNIIRDATCMTDPNLIHLFKKWKKQLCIHRPIQMVHGTQSISPFVTGIIRPVIYLPDSLLTTKNYIIIESIIAHELAHIRYWDTLWIHIQGFLQICYFFHPAVWIASYHLNTFRESFADSCVIKNNRFSRDHYCHSIIELIKLNYTEAHMKAGFKNNKKELLTRISALQLYQGLNLSKRLGLTLLIIISFLIILPMHFKTNPKEAQDQTKSEQINHDSAIFMSPLPNKKIVSHFDPTMHPIKKKEYFHQGIDIAVKKGTPILASAVGQILLINDPEKLKEGYGYHVIIRHDQGFQTVYAHMDTVLVQCNQTVKQGQTIGTVGNTGVSTGPHLHFEVRLNEKAVNPETYINF